MAAAGIAVALLGILALGAGLLRALGISPATDRIAHWGWAWVAGCAAAALLTLGWLAAGQPCDGRLLGPAGLALGTAVWLRARRREVLADPAPAGAGYLLLLALLLAVQVDAASEACLSPILLGDEANIWAAKAKALYTADGLGLPFALEATFYPVEHADYPILVPLLHVWIHAAAGDLAGIAPRLPLIGVQIAFVLILASCLRRVAPAWLAALLLLAVAGHAAPLRLAGDAGADVPLACGLLLAFDGWRRWLERPDPRFAALAGLGLGWTAWTKNEGLALVLLAVAAVALAAVAGRPRGRAVLPRGAQAALVLLPPAVVIAGQRALNAWWGFANDLFAVSGHDGSTLADRSALWIARAGEVAAWFAENVLFRIAPSDDGVQGPARLLLPLTAGALLLGPGRARQPAVLAALAVTFGGLAAYFAVFLITPHELPWHLRTAAQRISFHVVPLAAVALGMLLTGRTDPPRPASEPAQEPAR